LALNWDILMRVTSKGQVTIPQDLRKLAGIEPNSEVLFGIENGKITIEALDAKAERDSRERLRRFLDALDRLEGTGDRAVSADDVMSVTRDR
jgi:AbrB family looped-hinge helix DNA binding protein